MPGVQFCGRMALLAEFGGYERAGRHDGVRWSAPGQAAVLSASISGWILFSSIWRRR